MEEPSVPLSPVEPPAVESPPTEAQAAPPKRRRWPWVLGALAAIAVLFVFFIASVELLHYTESTAFCSLCHVMKPEYTAYEHSPHARAECGSCHIGPGALAAVQVKLANVRYVWVYPTNSYERPIPSPIHSLRPVEIVCEQCHWPEKFYQDRLVVLSHYGTDEQNSLTQTALLMKTGGGQESAGFGRGIHWHIANPVYYIATDEKRQNIPWVQAEYEGKITEYIATDSTLTAADIAQAEKRKMDCVDCHNRASHDFRRPTEALDEALAAGLIPADLPAIKQQGAAVLEQRYQTEAEAAQAIAAVADYYKNAYPDVYNNRQADVQKAISELQAIFDRSTFPFMNVTWESHPNNIGHKDFPGCFRCHDGKHLSVDNQAIRLECNICHSIPEVALPGQAAPAIAALPAANEPDSHRRTTWLSEHRFQFDATCADCHTLDNPGGSDNSSFCSNSACHATEWKFVGLNAPKVRELSAPPSVPSQGVARPIPHPISATTDCVICHGAGAVKPFPENHTAFTPEMCANCHQATMKEGVAAPGAAPAIPHQLEGMGECQNCHAAGGIRPWPENHAAFTSDICTNCHKADQPGVAPGAARAVPHQIEGGMADCKMCHAADGIRPWPANHAAFTPDLCGNCHALPQGSAAPASTPDSSDDSDDMAGGPMPIPHEVTGREQCLACHNPDGGLKPAPSDHAGRTNDSCQTCHKPKA